MNEITVREVSLRRKFNLGNYETLDVEFVATVGPGQDPMEILKALDAKTIEHRKARKP